MTKASSILDLMDEEDNIIRTLFIEPLVTYLEDHIPRNKDEAILADYVSNDEFDLYIANEDGVELGRVRCSVAVKTDFDSITFQIDPYKTIIEVQDVRVSNALLEDIPKMQWNLTIPESYNKTKKILMQLNPIGDDAAKYIFKTVGKHLK